MGPGGWGAEEGIYGGLSCCLPFFAGLESPSHALRADADPWANSATTTCVTLAEPHRYDRDLEIILYPCGEGDDALGGFEASPQKHLEHPPAPCSPG